jgi:hypothetical protein
MVAEATFGDESGMIPAAVPSTLLDD